MEQEWTTSIGTRRRRPNSYLYTGTKVILIKPCGGLIYETEFEIWAGSVRQFCAHAFSVFFVTILSSIQFKLIKEAKIMLAHLRTYLFTMTLNETAVLVFAICSLYSRFRLPCHYFLTSKRQGLDHSQFQKLQMFFQPLRSLLLCP